MRSCCFFVFFFFQAEDGIRDTSVTGVQTCALPIYPARRMPRVHRGASYGHAAFFARDARHKSESGSTGCGPGKTKTRSEERRVGKERKTQKATEQNTEKQNNNTRCLKTTHDKTYAA